MLFHDDNDNDGVDDDDDDGIYVTVIIDWNQFWNNFETSVLYCSL